MQLILSNAGGYPNSGPTEDLQVLVRARAAVDRGEKTAADVVDAENVMVRRAIEEQVAAGVELVTDGMTRWRDAVSHLAGKLAGVRLAEPRPLPGMGGVYRVPVLTARPAWRAPLLADEYRFACNALGALGTPSGKAGKLAVKAVLPGAYSLAKLSEAGDGIMNTMEARAEAFAEALAAEIQALASGGAEHIQVNEPAFFERDEDWPLFCRCVETVARARDAARQKGRKCDLTLSVSYTGAGHFYERLFELPMDVLALDCTGDNRLFERAAAAGSAKPLCLALVSGRNDQMEDAAALTRKLEGTLPNMSASRVYLGPSWGLETLPRDRARAKLELLARVRQNLSPSRATA